jgi:hypothetical protein
MNVSDSAPQHVRAVISRLSVVAIALGASLLACEAPDPPGTLIAWATFDNDSAEASPDTTLPGDPAGDSLSLSGNEWVMRVRSSEVFPTKFLELGRGDTANTVVRLLPPTTSAGRYKMSVTGVVFENESPTSVRFIAGSAGELDLSFQKPNKIIARNGDTPLEVGAYELGVPHTVRVDLQASLGRAIIDVQSPAGQTHSQYVRLRPSTESGPAIEFAYAGMFVEAFRARYGVDQMSIRRL